MSNENSLKNLKKFEPGHPGGPGRPKMPAELHTIKTLSKGELMLLFNKILNAKPEQLKDFKSTVLEVWLASGVSNAIKQGDFSRLVFFMDRLFGKVPDKVELSEADKLKSLPTEELINIAKSFLEDMKQDK